MATYDADGFIQALEYNEVIVVGTNLAGEHHSGAARQAFDNFGLEWEIGEGLCGDTYAFPTLDERMQRLHIGELHCIKHAFYRCVRSHPKITFILTKVGCGIAGYPEWQMKKLFEDAGQFKNLVLPEEWR